MRRYIYMKQLSNLLQKQNKGLQDVTAVDFDRMGVRCIRMKKVNEALSIHAAAILSPLDVNELLTGEADKNIAYTLPKIFAARYVAVALPSEQAQVKLLNLPGQADDTLGQKVQENMALNPDEFRIGYRVLNTGHGRTETKVLAVAIPTQLGALVPRLFPVGIPAPISIEVAGVASMSAFLNGPVKLAPQDAIGVIETGATITYVAFFNKGELALIRTFDFGYLQLLEKIQQNLGVDRETAQGIMSDGSFDISHSVKEVADPFIKQLVVSRYFVERRENCRISKVFLAKGASMPVDWMNEIKTALGLEVDFWNPFDGLQIESGAVPQELDIQASRFSAAIGAAVGTLEEPVS